MALFRLAHAMGALHNVAAAESTPPVVRVALEATLSGRDPMPPIVDPQLLADELAAWSTRAQVDVGTMAFFLDELPEGFPGPMEFSLRRFCKFQVRSSVA